MIASAALVADPELSLHQRIVNDIEGKILSGEWAPGQRIPFELELAALYNCSRMTVNKAMTQLARAGLIERRKKSGSFVTQPHAQSDAVFAAWTPEDDRSAVDRATALCFQRADRPREGRAT